MLLNVKKIWWYLIIFVLFISILGYILFMPKVAHIYVDLASTPTLLQMVDMIRQDAKEEKLMLWNRIRNIGDRVDLSKYNMKEISFDSDTEIRKDNKDFGTLMSNIYEFTKNHVNYRYIIHANVDHMELLVPILQYIPENMIKHIHLYEDSIGKAVMKKQAVSYKAEDIKEAIRTVGNIDYNYYRYNLHKIYPVTYHLAFKYYIENSPTMQNFRTVVPTDLIEDVNIHNIAKSLTDVEKQKLSELLGINIEDFNKESNIVIFALGYMENNQGNNAQIELLRFIKQSVKDKNYTWFYKEHPWLTNDTYLSDVIKREFPDMKEIRKDIPLEVLILLGGKSFKFAGYSSSIFMTVPPKDIIYYVRRPKDVYLPFLFEQNIVSPKQVLNIVDYIREINDVQK